MEMINVESHFYAEYGKNGTLPPLPHQQQPLTSDLPAELTKGWSFRSRPVT